MDSDSDVIEVSAPSSLPLKRAAAPATAPPAFIPLLLAKNLTQEDPTGYFMSEKLDGVRCYWNGQSFISRKGNPYTAPAYFTEKLPPHTSLDGELWLGRGEFQDCVSIARCSDNGKNDMSRWRSMKYMVFDAPSLTVPFEQRIEFIQKLIKSIKSPYIVFVEQVKCRNRQHLNEELSRVEQLGGEGVMLRKANSLYEGKRSSTLLKVKSFLDDEAEVIGYEQGKGKFKGVVGAFRVRASNGKEFKIGSGLTDRERVDPPDIGSFITYKYQELSKDGIPRFPTFFRKRE